MKLKAWLVAIFDLEAEEETFSCDSRVYHNHKPITPVNRKWCSARPSLKNKRKKNRLTESLTLLHETSSTACLA